MGCDNIYTVPHTGNQTVAATRFLNKVKDIAVENQKVVVCDLKLANKNARKISDKMNKELGDLKTKLKKEEENNVI